MTQKFKHEIIIHDDNGDIGNIVAARKRAQTVGWTVRESIGMGIINPRGIAAAKKSVVIK